ncbi:hypothetical protein ACKI1J_17000 [Streptomyces scabiei]|uniref:Secreted protein n=1 Tax=Streptomyces niveiscabiei TaxID=164115 RepID=A0ABW9HYS9_9ACTN|nr:hypothetical protein [Streptomyces europaeiscabiei]MDX3866534.1 hypothetical protein [Streptomyces europaeiscabiei]MDX3874529.1 hypothetical protein [Streptomyces europaeiscabiei]
MAAGVGVGGVVITSAIGWHASRKSAAAQVDAALAGVRAQMEGQRQETLWQIRRDAYASFLGQIGAVRMAIAHMYATCCLAEEQLGGAGGATADLTGAKESLTESFKALWFRESALRLSVDREEAERAEELMKLARRAVDSVSDYAEAIWSHQDTGPSYRRTEAAMVELHTGVEEWASVARLNLEPGRNRH